MAVFGVPVVHEDEALRAVRAAAVMRHALPELGLEGRIGVMTGEVVTGTDERLATPIRHRETRRSGSAALRDGSSGSLSEGRHHPDDAA
jgi:imidazolonepropionase-like amidohydrolase